MFGSISIGIENGMARQHRHQRVAASVAAKAVKNQQRYNKTAAKMACGVT